jgi:hypothetical protein
VVLTALGCGSEAPLTLGDTGGEQVAGEKEPGPKGGAKPGTKADDEADPFAAADVAPGYVPFDYPEGPYGIVKGATIENLRFQGWSSPSAAGYAVDAAAPLQLSDFYDPTGEKGVELLLINSSAVWCGVCRGEYDDLRSYGIYTDLSKRGLQMLGVLFEDNDGEPARYVDLVNWGTSFEVQFPLALDPGFKTGVFFNRSATPMNMLVDARTMQILELITGYDPTLYETAGQILSQRGR